MPRLPFRTLFLSLLTLCVVSLPSIGADESTTKAEQPKETLGYGAYTDSQGHNETYWRERMSSLKARVRQLEGEVDRLERNAEGLRFQWSADDATGTKKKAWDDQLNRLQKARVALGEAEADLAKAEREARRAGALPGWLRPNKQQEAKEVADREASARASQQGVTNSYDMQKLQQDNKKADKDVWGEGKDEEKATPTKNEENNRTATDEPGDKDDDKNNDRDEDEPDR